MYDIVVIGGGASAMFCTALLAKSGLSVAMIERNEKLGKKLFITGKGRCNVTNAKPANEVLEHIMTNSKFLYSSLYGFDSYSVMDFFEKNGLKLKIERGDRVFPQSDKSSDVIKTLETIIKSDNNIDVFLLNRVQTLSKDDEGIFETTTNKETFRSKSVVVATGGLSYPITGSTGDGYALLESFGHSVTKLSEALVPFVAKEKWVTTLAGLSLVNCEVSLFEREKLVKKDFGEMLFTHRGVSGPTILYLSNFVSSYENAKIKIDLKPALSEEKLNERLLRDFTATPNKSAKTALDALVPKSLGAKIFELSKIEPMKKINQITISERAKLVSLLKGLEIHIVSNCGFDEAIITKGGINIKEVNPKTMESKKCNHCYIIGEILDMNALTGGYNLQIAFSTANACVKSLKETLM